MQSPIRIGLVGYGFGGRFFHAPLIAAEQACDFVGVVTTSPERRAQVAEHWDRPTYDSLEHLVRAGAEAVAVSTPAATHVPLVRRALELGLAVVCDKPFALDAASARATVELAEELGRPLTVYQNRRWDSDFLTLRALLEGGRLGSLVRYESRFERFAPGQAVPLAGGGTLVDFGSHLVDQALVLSGPVASVYAEMHRRDDTAGLDDDVFVALTHRNGVRSHLWGSWRQGSPGPRMRATGTTGTFVVDRVDGQEQALLAGATPESEGDHWGREPEQHRGHVRRGDVVEPASPERGRWDLFYAGFAAAVRGTGPVPVDPWDAVATATVLDAALSSAREGRVVQLS
ncbi:Gfo/Idh/MocA family oxidoreductase [Embleya sp. NBC_00888]|uniref:Gfo/Idh/MocA family protein n=1 Tax=Embleya sp. NBC_00888 TaxID=2975960 RepID=UPI00386FCD28|nr:Gfo/Idh/MocA family oxidoreductase [Embleya sp. NBC_00888]